MIIKDYNLYSNRNRLVIPLLGTCVKEQLLFVYQICGLVS
jgi:hypothetical protein